MIYKFRMLLEGNEGFMREYELHASHTFANFHELIQSTVAFKSHELASFFMCDNEWDRHQEITLLNMGDMAKEEEGDESVGIIAMQDAFLRDYMNEPRQRIIYEYDFLKPKTFYIELNGVGKVDESVAYPHCIYSRGEMELEKTVLPLDDEAEVEEGGDFDDDFPLNGLDELLKDLGTEDFTIEGPEEE